MVEIDASLVDRISIHDESFDATDLIRTLERNLPETRPGVPRETVEAYARELGYRSERLAREIESRSVDSTTWQPGGKLYRVGENLSAYPEQWHELVDPADLRDLVRAMQEQVASDEGFGVTVTKEGVSQRSLLLAVEAMTGLDRREGKRVLHRQRDRDELILTADQNPEAAVRLPDDA